ncbi:unnamed protein product [Rhizoctonia solani]|uniref:Uncharacterized protein n=1 Tax=Rhizoctonia solani TaxID=456999 RepID=A0A8H2XAC8_9AGAM|nr:unnamed protein product [Rhizoctonia solani]
MSAHPKKDKNSGLQGAADNLGAGLANFGNAQGAAMDSLLSGTTNAVGTLLSGTMGSGAVNTAFQNPSDQKKKYPPKK